MSGPEYRGIKFQPEIIQFGLIIADAEGNLVEKMSRLCETNFISGYFRKNTRIFKD